MYTETVDGFCVPAIPVADRFGWTTFSAVERKQVSLIVDTAPGADTTVDIVRTSPSRAIRPSAVCSLLNYDISRKCRYN